MPIEVAPSLALNCLLASEVSKCDSNLLGAATIELRLNHAGPVSTRSMTFALGREQVLCHLVWVRRLRPIERCEVTLDKKSCVFEITVANDWTILRNHVLCSDS